MSELKSNSRTNCYWIYSEVSSWFLSGHSDTVSIRQYMYIYVYHYILQSTNIVMGLTWTARTLILDVGVPGRSTLEFILLYAVKNIETKHLLLQYMY